MRIKTIQDVNEARILAHTRRGANSMESLPHDAVLTWLAALVGDVGEVAHLLACAPGGAGDNHFAALRLYLIELLAVGTAWVEAIDGHLDPDRQVGAP